MPWGGAYKGGAGAVPAAPKGGGWGSHFRSAPTQVNVGPAKKSGGGFLHDLAKYSGADLVKNLATDIGTTAIGVGPGLYHAGHALEKGTVAALTGDQAGIQKFNQGLKTTGTGIKKQYVDYYGHDVLHHLYTHPLQPVLDALTVATGGASTLAKGGEVAAKAGAISDESRLAKLGQRATITTRSPRNIATGKGPVHKDITSTKPLVKGRAIVGPKITGEEGLNVGPLKLGGETKRYGKQIQAQTTQAAMGRMAPFDVYTKATKGLSHNEWTALHIRAMDIHPSDLAQLWKGTPLEKTIADPKVQELALHPSKKMLVAEPQARMISQQGAALYHERGLLKEETAAARPELTKQQAAETLGRPVKEITGKPYYFPHTMEPARNVNPLKSAGGGKAMPRTPGSTKQNLGVLALHGKLHLRSDVLGPEFLRRVKYVKYDEIHNALVRGSLRLSHQDLVERHGGQLPKGYEYVREKASTRIPPTVRGEGQTHTPIAKLIPDPGDLHDSQLAKDGFSTTDPAQAHQAGGHYYIIPKTTARAATGEFTRSGDLTRALIKRPLSVWRSAVLGLRVGFFTNNFVGNSIMYAAHTGGKGALRDLFGAIMESHGRDAALKVLKDPATPPALRTDLYKEFFPEQIQGTFGRTQSPSTSAAHLAGQTFAEGYRKVTGVIPRVTSKVAEETPRRALIRNEIRHSPEFKAAYQALPKQTRTFEQAARNVLEGKGGKPYQRFISKQVNQALGDYLNLSPFERNVLRNALPFYSWYRAIAQTTYHLAADTPLRAEALAMIGRVGAAGDTANVPSFLKGAIPLGPGPQGTQRVLPTQGLNPYATLAQMLRGTTTDYTSLGLNPFLEGPLQYIQRARGNVSPLNLAVSPLVDLVKNLPPSRLLAPPGPSKLYPTRKGRGAQLPGFLGAGVKEYDPNVAAQQARQGR